MVINKIDNIKTRFEREIREIVDAIKTKYKPQKIILFGSFSSEEINEHSDIDLCIIKETDKRFIDRIGDVLDIIDSSFPVEAVVYTVEEFDRMKREKNPFINEIIKKGKILYEQ
ncbi:MAG: nucleotidyltransferase domain-containing protein [Candidatus Hydrogenedentota bacterium]